MIAPMPKKVARQALRYGTVPVDKLDEWATALQGFARELKAAHLLAKKKGVAEFRADGANGFDDYVARAERLTQGAIGHVRAQAARLP